MSLHLSNLTAPFGLPLLVTVMIILLYALSVLFRWSTFANEGRARMAILTAFVLAHRTGERDPKAFIAKPGRVGDPLGRAADEFLADLSAYRDQGRLPTANVRPPIQIASLIYMVSCVVIAPLTALIVLMQTVRERQRIRTEIATHLEERRYEMCTAAVTLASSCALALVMILLSETVEGWQRTAYLALTALGVVGVVTSVITITLYIHIQRRAKAFWMEELVAIMGTASLQEDHAGFSRALLLYGEIRNEPDIPIPGTVGVYASIFAIAQWLLH